MAAGLVGKAGELRAAGADGRGRTHLHPLLDGGDLRIGEFGTRLARGHRELGIGLMDRHDKQRLLEVARHDGRALVAAGEQARAGIHDEAALGDALLLGVALVAALGEDRADVLLEELEAGRIHLGFGRGVGGARGGGDPGGEDEGQEAEQVGRALHGWSDGKGKG